MGTARHRKKVEPSTPETQRKSTSEGERRSCLSPTKRQLQFEGAPETLGESATSTAAAAAAAKRSRSLAKTMKTAGKGLSDHILAMAASAAVTAVLCSLVATQMATATVDAPPVKPSTPSQASKNQMGLSECDFKAGGASGSASGSVVVSILMRNADERLTPFLWTIASQSYPKHKTCLMISTDNNADGTEERLDKWISSNREKYAGIEYIKPSNATLSAPSDWASSDSCEFRPHCWSRERQQRVALLRHTAYRRALGSGARYFMSIDADVLLGNPDALKLTLESMPTPAGVVAPQLLAHPNTWDSNVWLETTDDGHYTRGQFQLSFRSRKFRGCVQASAVHSFFAVDLNARNAKKLEFFNAKLSESSSTQLTDISFFSLSAKRANVPMYGCNTFSPGVTPSIAGQSSYDNTHKEEAEVFMKLAGDLILENNTPSEQRYAKYWPDIADETAFKCTPSSGSNCHCPRDNSREITAQLEELRNATLHHLDRVAAEGHIAVCAWNGDCSDKHFTVDRRSNLSLEEFHNEYAMMRRPVVITDYINGTNRLSKTGEPYDAAYWKRVCGGRHFSIQMANKSRNWGGLSGYSTETLNNSFDVLADPNLDPTVYGIFDSPLTRSCQEAIPNFVMPKYFANDFMQRVHHNVSLTYRDSWPSFFLGRGGTGGNLHVDMFGSSFWMAVFEGKKHWRFVDEGQRHLLYENRPTNDFPDVDLFNPDFERFPLLRHVRIFDAVLNPGDLLFVPGSSPHQVRNVEGQNCIALAGNYIDAGSLETARQECDHKDRGQYSRYREIVETVLQPHFPAEMDLSAEDMEWDEWKAQATWIP